MSHSPLFKVCRSKVSSRKVKEDSSITVIEEDILGWQDKAPITTIYSTYLYIPVSSPPIVSITPPPIVKIPAYIKVRKRVLLKKERTSLVKIKQLDSKLRTRFPMIQYLSISNPYLLEPLADHL